MKLSKMVRSTRQAAGLKLADLAKRARISSSYLSRIENGERLRNPSERLLLRLASALGLQRDDVFRAAGRLPDDVVRWVVTTPGALERLREDMAKGKAAA